MINNTYLATQIYSHSFKLPLGISINVPAILKELTYWNWVYEVKRKDLEHLVVWVGQELDPQHGVVTLLKIVENQLHVATILCVYLDVAYFRRLLFYCSFLQLEYITQRHFEVLYKKLGQSGSALNLL